MVGVCPGSSAPTSKRDRRAGFSSAPGLVRVRLRNMLATTSAAWVLAGLSACSSVPDLPPAPPAPPPDTGYVSSSALPPYKIQVGDVLAIRLILNPELN